MHPVWAQRRKEILSDCLVSPDVFTQMVERLGEFVIPYQHALETEASGCHVHLYLQGLLSHLERKNAEKIAAFVDVERQVIQDGCRSHIDVGTLRHAAPDCPVLCVSRLTGHRHSGIRVFSHAPPMPEGSPHASIAAPCLLV